MAYCISHKRLMVSNNVSKNHVQLSTNMCMYIKPTIEKLITASTLTVAKNLVIFLFNATNIYYICSFRTVSTAHTKTPMTCQLSCSFIHGLALLLPMSKSPSSFTTILWFAISVEIRAPLFFSLARKASLSQDMVNSGVTLSPEKPSSRPSAAYVHDLSMMILPHSHQRLH